MKRVVALVTGLLLVVVVGGTLGAQEPLAVPDHAVVIPLGVEEGSYEALQPGARGGTLYLSVGGNPESWNPIVTKTTYVNIIASYCQQALMTRDATTGVLEGELAESWAVSQDNLEIVFHLRRGLTWSDGEPFTADDVLFTFNDLVLNNDVDTGNRDLLRLPGGGFPEIEKVDDYTVRVVSPEVFRPLLDAFTLFILPKHKLAPFVHKLNPEVPAGTFNGAWGVDTPVEELVGLGPFTITRYEPDLVIKLERNPFYYHYDPLGTQLPYLDEIVIQVGVTGDLTLLQFLNGEVDMIQVRAPDMPILKAQEAQKGFTVTLGEVAYEIKFLGLNQDTEAENLRNLFRKLPFRQAVSHAIDRQHIIDILEIGLAYPLWSLVSVPSPFYAGRERYGGPITERDAVTYTYDLERAAELLDACGIADRDGDGLREFEDGSDVEFTLSYGAKGMGDVAIVIADDLAKLGITAKPLYVEFNTLVGRLLSGTVVEGVLIALSGGDDPHGGVNVYSSEGDLHFWHYSAGHGDRYEYEARIDELYRLGAGTYDMDEAFGYYKEIQTLFARQDLGLIFTAATRFTCATYDRIGNAQLCAQVGAVYGGPLAELLYIRAE